MNRKQYKSDPRYAKVLETMDLLGIMDVTTTRQHKNGTIVWKLPIKNWNSGKTNIEVASFSTGYVRNQNSGYSNYQLNKTKKIFENEWPSGYKYYSTRRTLIPIEIDRLEYLISYCLKNYFIKRANEVADGKLIPKWRHEWELERANETYSENTGAMARIEDLEEKLDAMTEARDYYQEKIHQAHDKHNKAYNDGYAAAEVDYKGMLNDLSVTVNGERYKII